MNTSITARELFDQQRERLGLRWAAGKAGEKRELEAGNTVSRRPSLAGYLNAIYPNKVQILGTDNEFYKIAPPKGVYLYVDKKFVNPVRRLDLIGAETAARQRMARPQIASGVFGFVAVQRLWYRFLARQRTVNLVVTNVPGPPVPLYLAGARLLEVFPVAAIMGNVTLAVAVFSYAGQLNFTAIADRDTCPDVEVFAQGMRRALDELARSLPAPVPG